MMPGAVDKRLANQKRQGRMKGYQAVTLHTMVGSLAGTDGMFQKGGTVGTESHFGVGGDGTIYQWVDTAYSADANYLGSAYCISIETADHGNEFRKWNTSGDHVPAWTTAQLNAIAKIIAWAHETHGIPLKKCKDSSDTGVGWHAQGVPGNGLKPSHKGTRYQWSKFSGKVCPGKKRIAQVPDVISRAINETRKGNSVAPADPADWIDVATKFDSKYEKPQTVAAKKEIPVRVNAKGQHMVAENVRGRAITGHVSADVFGLNETESAEGTLVIRNWRTGKIEWRFNRVIVAGRAGNHGWPVSLVVPFTDVSNKPTSPDLQYQLLVRNTTNHPIRVENVRVEGLKGA